MWFIEQSYKESKLTYHARLWCERCLKKVDSAHEPLEGTTLAVYQFAVRFGRPIGTRDVQRNVGLSSASVAYRHLQKLTSLGLLSQTESGEYVVQAKARVRGYVWFGRHLLSRMLIYSFLFMAALAVEVVILLIHFGVENFEFMVFFFLITLITAAAMTLFLIESILRHLRRKRTDS